MGFSMRLVSMFFVAVASLVLAVSTVSADEYLIDTRGGHASVATKFLHQGISWLTAEFKVFEGSFFYDPDNVEASSINVTVDVMSLDSNHETRDSHILAADYLDAENFAQASFVSTSAMDKGNGSLMLTGDITLHGVSKEITVDVVMVGEGEVRGTPRLGFEGTTTLDLRDFGYDRFAPTHQVHLEVNVEGIQQ